MQIAGLTSPCWQRTVVVGVCLLIVQFVTATSVEASCGDWLASSSQMPPHSDRGVTTATRPAKLSTGLLKADSDDPLKENFCHGPNCQNAPSPASPSVPVHFPQTVQQWLQLPIKAVVQVAGSCRSTLPRNEILLDTETSDRLDRPPCC